MHRLLADLPAHLNDELTDVLIVQDGVRIERIISTGQSSPPDFWYDQSEHEWVCLLMGEAELAFEDQLPVRLSAGDSFFLPAGMRHRVAWTSDCETTVWLAVFWPPKV
jgi:cupin 2 domain-containing protein